MHLSLSNKLILIVIILLAAAFRFYNLNWDQGFHLHPDERAIIMTVAKLAFPQSIETFFSINSPWNPHFFAYGSFPFYLVYTVGQLLTAVDPQFATYSLLQIPGRFISAISDLLIVFVLFFLGKKLFNVKTGLLTSFFYAISVLSIQLSHFYAVDTLLTLFILLTLLQLIYFYENPTPTKALLIGVFFGLALATKLSAIVLTVSIGITLVVDFLLLVLKNPHRSHHWFPHLPNFFKTFTYLYVYYPSYNDDNFPSFNAVCIN